MGNVFDDNGDIMNSWDTIFLIAAYLIGVVPCYLLIRTAFRNKFGKWTRDDRQLALAISALGIIGYLLALWQYGDWAFGWEDKSERDANW